MNEDDHILEGLIFTDDPSDIESPLDEKSMPSPFTVAVDSNERHQYTFKNIYGDRRDASRQIEVSTVRRRLKTGDYQIDGMPHGITIERKAAADFMGSMNPRDGNGQNFIDRLRRMDKEFRISYVLIEIYPKDLLEMDWPHTSFNPLVARRAAMSWSMQFPTVHWEWAYDREEAEQVCYRLLNMFYQHETDIKYKHHNKPIDQAVEAFRDGQVNRMNAAEFSVPYPPGNHLRLHWIRGWNFASIHFYGGDLGKLYDGPIPAAGTGEESRRTRGKKRRSSDPMQEARDLIERSMGL